MLRWGGCAGLMQQMGPSSSLELRPVRSSLDCGHRDRPAGQCLSRARPHLDVPFILRPTIPGKAGSCGSFRVHLRLFAGIGFSCPRLPSPLSMGLARPATCCPKQVSARVCLTQMAPKRTSAAMSARCWSALADKPDLRVFAQAELGSTILALSSWGIRLCGRTAVNFICIDAAAKRRSRSFQWRGASWVNRRWRHGLAVCQPAVTRPAANYATGSLSYVAYRRCTLERAGRPCGWLLPAGSRTESQA